MALWIYRSQIGQTNNLQMVKREKGKTNNDTNTNAWPQSLYNALRESMSSQKIRVRSVCAWLTVKSTANNTCMETTNHIRKRDRGWNKSQCRQSTRNKAPDCNKINKQRSIYDRCIGREVTPNHWFRNTWWTAEHTIKKTSEVITSGEFCTAEAIKAIYTCTRTAKLPATAKLVSDGKACQWWQNLSVMAKLVINGKACLW